MSDETWRIETQEEWTSGLESSSELKLKDGQAVPTAKHATLKSELKMFATKRSAKSIIVTQSADWLNW
ncbi:MAG: hypothetical protein ABJM55_20685, partial [Rhodopirellula bahusiensis]